MTSKRVWKILALLIPIIALIFGDNYYEQITGHNVFHNQQEVATPIVIVITATALQTLPTQEEFLPTSTTGIISPATVQVDTNPESTPIPTRSGNETDLSEQDVSPTSPQQPEFIMSRSFCGNKTGSFVASPNEYLIGDIVIDNFSYTDMQDAIREGTIAYFEREAQVLANWGAGCWNGDISHLRELMLEEFEIGCGGSGCETLRIVIIRANENPLVTCYDSIDEIISCPITYMP